MEDLARLAELITAKNAIDNIVAAQIGRAAEKGHVGEYIASRVFGITLEKSASNKGSDGHFPNCRTVNVKWYAKHEAVLDLPSVISSASIPDDYLVLAGPRPAAVPTHGPVRPWVISSVFLFDAEQLIGELQELGVKVGIATSVRQFLWERAEIYPEQRNDRLILSPTQRAMLALFAPLKS
jgi:hypothetical protein